MCLYRIYKKIEYSIKSIIFGLETDDLIKFDNYSEDLKIYYTIKESGFLLDDILIEYIIGECKKITIDNNSYIIMKKYFNNCKSKILREMFEDDKKCIKVQLNIKKKEIIDFIIQFLLFYDCLKIIILEINFSDTPSFSYQSNFINNNIYIINKEGNNESFLKLVNYFQIYDFYNLQKYIKLI